MELFVTTAMSGPERLSISDGKEMKLRSYVRKWCNILRGVVD